MLLQEKYKNVIDAAQSASISNLVVKEQDGVLHVKGSALDSVSKDSVWDALSVVDPSYTANDIAIDIRVEGLESGKLLTVTTDSTNLNIRKDASTESDVVGKANRGDQVTLIEQSSSDWWKVKTKDGVEGYAYSRYLKS